MLLSTISLIRDIVFQSGVVKPTLIRHKAIKKLKKTNLSNVGDNIVANVGRWSFGGEVAKTFEDHITKSVPGYLEGHDLISKRAPFFLAEQGVKCFEIGCSTGKLTKTIRSYTKKR